MPPFDLSEIQSRESLRFEFVAEQTQDTSCGYAALATLLYSFWRVPTSEGDLIKADSTGLVHYDHPECHFTLAVGVHNGWMVVIDPARGCELWSEQEFPSPWSGAALLLGTMLAVALPTSAQEAHQRLGVEKQRPHSASLGLELSEV